MSNETCQKNRNKQRREEDRMATQEEAEAVVRQVAQEYERVFVMLADR